MAGKRIFVFALFALVAVAFALSARGGAEAQTYKPFNSYSLTSTVPGANSNSALSFSMAAPDFNYEDASMTMLLPPDALTANGLEAPIGAKVGTLNASVAVGLVGGPCSTPLTPVFDLYNASVDIADQLNDTSWILKSASTTPVPDSDADGLPDYIEQYPWFLNTMLDADGPYNPGPPATGVLLPIQPRARFAGHTTVAGFNVIVQFLVFNPSQMATAGGIYAQMTAEKGMPSYIVLDNPVGEGEATPGAISDFCTPLFTTSNLLGTTADNLSTGFINDGCPQVGAASESGAQCANNKDDDPADDPVDTVNDGCPQVGATAETVGPPNQCNNATDDDVDPNPNEAGIARQSNPAAGTGILASGTHISWNYSESERNQDTDLFENDLDSCRYSNDPANWNPRIPLFPACVPGANPGDQDCDMLPSSCDNAANGGNDNVANPDQDGDGYNNPQDNCPLVANGCKNVTCGPIWLGTWDNQEDTDSGLTNTDLGPRTDSLGDPCDDSDDDGNEDGAGVGTCNDGIDNGPDGTVDGNDANCTAAMDKVDLPVFGNPANPHQGTYYHGYPWDAVCVGGVDADGDGYCLALETLLGSSDADGYDANCADALDDGDADAIVNDGCPFVGNIGETGPQCLNALNDDAAADINDAGAINDGCPVIGVPESLVIDATFTAASALPAPTAAQSCSDGVDNDNNNGVDTDNEPLGCAPAQYAGDADKDGIADGSDNCPAAWNPTQTNTDVIQAPPGDAAGDACDTDDDNDGSIDAREFYLPTDPLDDCRNYTPPLPGTYKSDAWPPDINRDGVITVPGDILPNYSGKINAQVSTNPPTSWALSRADLNADRVLTVPGDILPFYSGKINQTCS